MIKISYLFYFLLFLSINSFIYPQQDSLDCQKLRSSLNVESRLDRDYGSWQFPDLIGGIRGLQKRLKYPEEAKKNNIEGRVLVDIIIDSLGKPLCPRVIRKHLGFGCEEEAIRLVMNSKFTPALLKNRPRTLQIIVPIVFSLKK